MLKRRTYGISEEDDDDDEDDFDVDVVVSSKISDQPSPLPTVSSSPSSSSSSMTTTSQRYVCSTLQSFATASTGIQHPRESNIRWTPESLVELDIHDAMKVWFRNNVTSYLANRNEWPIRVSPKRFLLNFGVSGSGRTTALVTLCAEHAINLITIRENVSTPSYIQDAYTQAKLNQPCIIYFENDRRITSSEKSAQNFRNNLYTAYTNSMNVRDDEVWTIIATVNPPQNLLNGGSRYTQFFVTHGDAVYTPVLTSRSIIRSIIVHILTTYTQSKAFRRPNQEWVDVIDKLTSCALYHTIKEIHTYMNDVFRDFMYSNVRASDIVNRHDIFVDRLCLLPSIKSVDRLTLWRNPYEDHHKAEKQWNEYSSSSSSSSSLSSSSDERRREDDVYSEPRYPSLPQLPPSTFKRYKEINDDIQHQRERSRARIEHDKQTHGYEYAHHPQTTSSSSSSPPSYRYSAPQSVPGTRHAKIPASTHFLRPMSNGSGPRRGPVKF